MKNIWMANRNGVVMLYGLSCVVIGAQKISSKKRKRGQESRFSSDDIAQNHGGSRPFGETRQILGEKFGPEFTLKIWMKMAKLLQWLAAKHKRLWHG